ncbi:hypothetical protein [Kocuria atrinae]|uniref:hypothetical protein n=1 Tax=Kocuria atrinae TaxID=592377 RepID=UPI0002D42E53|nr:hypothetical protein [Kocuria atrinae]
MTDSARGVSSSAWLWLLVACAVLTQSTVNLLRPVTSYKLLALQADSVTIGLTTAAYALVPLFTAVWLGRYSDRAPQLKLLAWPGWACWWLVGHFWRPLPRYGPSYWPA